MNKQLGAVQAIAGWGHHDGLVPEDAPWSDPFSEMRLEEEQSEREPFDARDLQTIFNAPCSLSTSCPWARRATRGYGCRCSHCSLERVKPSTQAFVYLTFERMRTGVPLMWFTRDTKAGRRLKTKTSERVVPVHPQLIATRLPRIRGRAAEGGRTGMAVPNRGP